MTKSNSTTTTTTTTLPPPDVQQEQQQEQHKNQNHTSFTADSPYFTAYVDKEMKNLNDLRSTLRDISSKAKTFLKSGVHMSEATKKLSLACKLQPSNSHSHNNNNSNNNNGIENTGGSFDENTLDQKEKAIFEQKKNSVGNEMVEVLQVLGKVSDNDIVVSIYNNIYYIFLYFICMSTYIIRYNKKNQYIGSR